MTRHAVIVAPSSGLGGGIERVIGAYREALTMARFDVTVVALRGPRRRRRHVASFLADCLRAFRVRPHVLVVGHIGLAPIALLAVLARPSGARLLLVYGQDAWERRMRWRERIALRTLTSVCISDYTRTQFVRRSGMTDNVLVVRPPVPVVVRASDHAVSTGVDRAGYVLCVTRMASNEPEKHIDWLLAAVALAHYRGWSGRLVVVGDGSDVGRLKALATSLGIEDVVSFLGTVEDEQLAELYANASVFALPSTQEGLGLVFMEAMAAGVPVVATDAGPLREIVSTDEGILIPPGDVQRWADAIVDVTADGRLRARLGDNGRQRAAAEFGAAQFAGRLAALVPLMRDPEGA